MNTNFVMAALRRSGSRRLVARRAGTLEGDEFKAARERIRRIQLGLGPNDPLPPEDGGEEEAQPDAVPSAPEGKGELDLAEGKAPAEPVVAAVTGDVKTEDAAETAAASDTEGEEEFEAVADAYAGTLKDVAELQPEVPETEDKKQGGNFFQALATDIGLVTLPGPVEVAQTFGTVLLLVALYTGFVAVVDYGSQLALGQLFSEFYQAARPEAPSL